MTYSLDAIDEIIGQDAASQAANDVLNADLTVHATYRSHPPEPETPENVARLRSALDCISAACPRDAYLKVIWAIKGTGWLRSKAMARAWCRRAPELFNEADFLRDWDSYDPQHPGGSIGVGTLFAMAKANGWDDGGKTAIESTEENRPGLDLVSRLRTWDPTASPPAKRDFLVDAGLFPRGTASVLAGLGGSMKTALAILLGMHAAAGVLWNGWNLATGQTLIVSGEDDADEFSRRVGGYAFAEFDPSKHATIGQRVHVLPLAGSGIKLTETVYGIPRRTGDVEAMIDAANAIAANGRGPVVLIVFDHARLFIGGDLNSSEYATAGMDACVRIAQETGAAVVLLAHSPKASIAPKRASEYGMGDILGSGAFVDNARFAAVMSTLAEDERKRFGIDGDSAKDLLALRIVKSNYSEAGRVVYMKKTPVPGREVAYPKLCQLSPPAKPAAVSVVDRVVAHIAANPGKYTRRKLRDLGGLKGTLQASERDVRIALDEALAAARVVEKQATAAEVDQHGVRPRDKVLHAPA